MGIIALNIKEALRILHNQDSKFEFRPEDLNKLFLIKLSTGDYEYVVHYDAARDALYLSVTSTIQDETIYFTFTGTDVYIFLRADHVKLPDADASDDEWFNFNVQHSNITKDDLYPELNTIRRLLMDEYNRILLKTLEYRGL